MKFKFVVNKIYFFLLLIILVLFHHQKIFAESSEWVNYDQGKVRLIAERLDSDKSSHYLGLHFDLLPGWKIFWRSPGEAGYPLDFKNIDSTNVSYNNIEWPYPERFNFQGIYTYGYKKEVVLPLKLKIINNNLDSLVSIELNFLTCSDVCIPKKTHLALPIFRDNENINEDKSNMNLLVRYLDKVPKTAEVPLKDNKIYFVPESDKSVLKIYVDSDKGFNNPNIFVETALEVNFDTPKFNFMNKRKKLEIELPIKDNEANNYESLLNKPINLIFVNDGKAKKYNLDVEIRGEEHSSSKDFWIIIFLAIIGGLILNVMPCVLPILSLKLIDFLDKRSLGTKYIRLSFLFNTLGIFFTFLFLAFLIVIFRIFGVNLGWGFHFQEPIFTYIVMAIILFFSLNLFGLINLKLPYWLIPSMVDHSNQKESNNLKVSFFNGLFATVLATPCTAPIIGTTVTFALQSDTLNVFLIFASMGLGMSLPLILFAVFPNLIFFLPKAGKWTLNIKKFLGFLLLITAIWLLTVLFKQVNIFIFFLLLSLTFLIFLIFIKNKSGEIKIKNNYLRISMFAIVLTIAISIIIVPQQKERDFNNNLSYLETENLNKYLLKGKVVFVDITAEWCITCKVNKYLVLDTNEVKNFFKEENIIYIEIDWTRRDPKVLQFINSFNRSGIPLNIVYGRVAPNGIVLPEILTKENLNRAIEIAKGPKVAVEK